MLVELEDLCRFWLATRCVVAAERGKAVRIGVGLAQADST